MPMHRFLVLTLLLTPLPAAAQDSDGRCALKTFGDWVVGCDDRLTCTAIGMVGDLDLTVAYLKIVRDGGPAAEPRIHVTALDEVSTGPVELALSLESGALPVDRLAADASQSYPAGEILPDVVRSFVGALLPAQSLTVQSNGGEAAVVSLAGMSAALRWIDDAQGRVDGVTALVAGGPAEASAVPAPPQVEPVRALALSEIDPAPSAPPGVPKRDEFCNEYATDVAYDLPDGRRLFGVCSFNGAYNIGYDYYLVEADGTTVAPVLFPGATGTPHPDDRTLVNPGLSEDGRHLLAFNKGRGLSDCGDSGDWVFDGTAFRLVSYAVMPECRGVSSEDWPVIVSVPVE